MQAECDENRNIINICIGSLGCCHDFEKLLDLKNFQLYKKCELYVEIWYDMVKYGVIHFLHLVSILVDLVYMLILRPNTSI